MIDRLVRREELQVALEQFLKWSVHNRIPSQGQLDISKALLEKVRQEGSLGEGNRVVDNPAETYESVYQTMERDGIQKVIVQSQAWTIDDSYAVLLEAIQRHEDEHLGAGVDAEYYRRIVRVLGGNVSRESRISVRRLERIKKGKIRATAGEIIRLDTILTAIVCPTHAIEQLNYDLTLLGYSPLDDTPPIDQHAHHH